ncbi:MAG: ribosome small subunit-dependent GTPase A [Desulfobacter sp.]|nr:MAG: ribosome small subunit-dependent GTPase A [Desulfobacter sp.]
MTIKNKETHIYTNNVRQPLLKMGWDSHFQVHLDNICNDTLFPARVVGVQKNSFFISQGDSESLVTVAGKLNHHKKSLFPVTGDWVLVKEKVISAVLPRKKSLSRGASGTHGKQKSPWIKEQIIAANLDIVFIVCGLDRDYNIRRIERYLTLVYNCELTPCIILTKADLHQNPEHYVQRVESVAFNVPVHLISANDSTGLASLEPYLSQGRTIAIVGSSGAGKSTLVNRLAGKTIQPTNGVSDRLGKGKHTTTSRSLIMMPQGGMVIDNPGIREIGLWDDDGGLKGAFPEIEDLANTCRFQDCSHTHEIGCQVLQGVSIGTITKERLENYQKMKRELAYLSDRQTKSADRVEKEHWKKITLKIKAINRRKNTHE